MKTISFKTADNPFQHHRLAALFILAFILAACEPQQFTKPESVADAQVTRAEQFSMDGQHGAAAAVYRELANHGTLADRQRYLILAVSEYRLGRDLNTARQLFSNVMYPIADQNRLLWTQVSAEMSLSLGRPEQALEYLAQAPETTDRESTAGLLLIRSEALFRLNQPTEAVASLLERETWLDGRMAMVENHRLIWRGLQNWGSDITPESWQNSADPVLSGWLQLAYLTLPLHSDPSALRFVLTNWQLSHPDHPANQSLLGELLAEQTIRLNYPRKVALLLPLSGRQQQTAAAIRDGFLAAHYAVDFLPVRADIMIYDVQKLGAAGAYHQAIVDGADFVVGPLLKDAALKAAEVAGNTPTLALNFLPDNATTPSHFFQFSLSPEDEARQAAQTAMAAGQFRAIALAPDNSWGQRMLTSFASAMEQGGGRLLDYRYYDPRSVDYSATIQALLLIDESKSRYQRLSANLGEKLTFEPRLREDVDLIFLAARSEAGKALRPQLRFHFAGNIPTYATSAIFQEGSRNNSDLNGIMLTQIPWIIQPDADTIKLKTVIADQWPAQAARRARFYAMGYDAYQLMPLLYGQAQFGNRKVPGLTGELSMDSDGRIHRQLPWVRMTRGRPVLMEANTH